MEHCTHCLAVNGIFRCDVDDVDGMMGCAGIFTKTKLFKLIYNFFIKIEATVACVFCWGCDDASDDVENEIEDV